MVFPGVFLFIMKSSKFPVDILLVEDNPGDVRLIVETFKDMDIPHNLAVARDGLEAIQILNNDCKDSTAPKLIILDLNLPKKNGWDVLKEIKKDDKLKPIPVIILTTSKSNEDIKRSYDNQANAYLIKPMELDNFIEVVKSIHDFWLKRAELP